MRVKFIHHRQVRWPHPGNHLDGRVCPDCAVTVHGWDGQRDHERWHEQMDNLLRELAKRCGIAEELLDEPWSWGAEITGTEGEIERAEDAG